MSQAKPFVHFSDLDLVRIFLKMAGINTLASLEDTEALEQHCLLELKARGINPHTLTIG